MDRKIKLAATISLLGLTAAACAPNPYYNNGYNYGSRTTTQTGGAVNRGAAVSHTHCGRTHSHALPAEGLAHHHGDGCLAGSGGTATTATNNNYAGTGSYGTNYNYGYNQPPATNTNTNTYGYNPPAATQPYDYSTGSSSSSNYNYSVYADPKPSTSYTPAPSNRTTYPSSTSTNTYSGGGSYTVQKGDTVFQVMRNTGVYWKDIIRLNNLQAPNYTITPGQTLKLK